jgi:rod shape-determining protein MreD
MIVTRRIALLIALIVIVAVILQTSFFSYLSILGATPYVVPVVIVAVGLLGGAVVGAVSGFAAGFLLDSILLQTLGVSSLVLLSIGYLAGRYREGFEFKGLGVPALLSGGFTLLATTAFAAIQLVLGVDADVSLLVVREIFVQSLLAILLGFAVYPICHRILRTALIDYQPEPPRKRRLPRLPRLRRRKRGRERDRDRVRGGEGAPAREYEQEHGGRPARPRRPRRVPVHGAVR